MQSSFKIIKNSRIAVNNEKDIPLKDYNALHDKNYSTTQAKSLIKIANDEAKRLIRETENIKNEIYNEILLEAQFEINSLKEQAYKEGIELGKKEGYQIGYSDGVAILKKEQVKIIKAANKEYDKAVDEIKTLISSTSQKIIELSLRIASQVIKKEIELDDTVIEGIVNSVLNEVKKYKHINIRVSSLDKKNIDSKHFIFQNVCPEAYITILVDRLLNKGDCIVETDTHMIDATVTTQMENIKKALLEVR